MSYPQIVEYNEAVQNPKTAFLVPELQSGQVEESPLGLPLVLSGGFALTYTVTCGAKKYAVRCFHRQIPQIEKRYSAIAQTLKKHTKPFVGFSYSNEGIRVRGKPYPIVFMEWVEGKTLGLYLDSIIGNKKAVLDLRNEFRELSRYLTSIGVAHGDLQNGNVMVDRSGRLKLIDYDGMYVPGMAMGDGSEVGHRHFQHPERASEHFGPEIDRFSFIAIDLSLSVVAERPELYKKFKQGGETIIFTANDFLRPNQSSLLHEISGLSSIRTDVQNFITICSQSISLVPTLEEFTSGRVRMASRPALITSNASEIAAYISPAKLCDASDFDAAIKSVGERAELIGCIVDVKEGIGKRGKGKGKPYVFVNFGKWNLQCTKLTIWSDGLSTFARKPDASWKGKWVSVVGLIDPPFEGKHYGKPYLNVGLTIQDASQISFLSAAEASFRLKSIGLLMGPRAGVMPKGKERPPATQQTGNSAKENSTIENLVGNTALNNLSKSTSHSQKTPPVTPLPVVSERIAPGVIAKHPGAAPNPGSGTRTSGLTANRDIVNQFRSKSAQGSIQPAPSVQIPIHQTNPASAPPQPRTATSSPLPINSGGPGTARTSQPLHGSGSISTPKGSIENSSVARQPLHASGTPATSQTPLRATATMPTPSPSRTSKTFAQKLKKWLFG